MRSKLPCACRWQPWTRQSLGFAPWLWHTPCDFTTRLQPGTLQKRRLHFRTFSPDFGTASDDDDTDSIFFDNCNSTWHGKFLSACLAVRRCYETNACDCRSTLLMVNKGFLNVRCDFELQFVALWTKNKKASNGLTCLKEPI